jgi:hypothetical protein
LAEVAVAAKPDTILRWFRKLVAHKFDGSRCRKSVGRPRVENTIEDLIVRLAQENPSWGYDRIVGALANLRHSVSDQTVGNVLKRHGLVAAPHASIRRAGATSFAPTWMCWPGLTSSPSRCSRSRDWSPKPK